MHWSQVLAWVMLAAGAQEPGLPPESLLLARIRNVMANTLVRQPNYTCVQQVERSRRRLPRKRFELHDVLRLEVALVDGKEMFAWPGARKFEQTDLARMVSEGAIGTGDFAIHARAVFSGGGPVFRHVGPETVRGHATVRFDFRVSRLVSGYRIRTPGHEAVTGYHGSFWTDAKTNELVRLEIDAEDIPEELGISSAHNLMDYERIRIGDSDFLLPFASELTMADLTGNESRNRTQFKDCRQYTGESVLKFDEAPESEPAAAPPAAETDSPDVAVEPGTRLEIRLATRIDSATSAVGDPVEAVLEQKLKVKGAVVLEKGAKLRGRITRLEQFSEGTLFDLRFFEILQGRGSSRFAARLDELIAPPPAMQMVGAMARLPRPRSGVRVRGQVHLSPGSHMMIKTMGSEEN